VSAKYTLEAGKTLGGHVTSQVRRINIFRYIFKGLSLDFAIALGVHKLTPHLMGLLGLIIDSLIIM
jgi:hypothetical protein